MLKLDIHHSNPELQDVSYTGDVAMATVMERDGNGKPKYMTSTMEGKISVQDIVVMIMHIIANAQITVEKIFPIEAHTDLSQVLAEKIEEGHIDAIKEAMLNKS